MILPVVLRSGASRDAEEATDYLNAHRDGLGQAFSTNSTTNGRACGEVAEIYLGHLLSGTHGSHSIASDYARQLSLFHLEIPRRKTNNKRLNDANTLQG